MSSDHELTKPQKRVNFEVESVKLENSNLIEASAGTGKTFSIAIIVLRLIVEQNMSIKQILMVTFTKAAVAELESRIREFIREAYRYTQDSNYKPEESQIKKVIDNVDKSISKAKIKDRLYGANLMLDETAIYTIHSFCQKTLSEFAFETQQLFTNDVLDDQSEIIEKAVNKYWREKITTLPVSHLVKLQSVGLSKDVLSETVEKALRGKQFIYKSDLDISLSFANVDKQTEKIERVLERFNQKFKDSEESKTDYIEKAGANPRKSFLHLNTSPEEFLDQLIEKQDVGYVPQKFPELLAIALTYDEELNKVQNAINDILYFYYGSAIEGVETYVDNTKHRLSIMTYDDLIGNLHKAVMGTNQDLLKTELQKKYRAVFIDEFQDTDKAQYEIFDTLFGKSRTLFYIGDPKQAIYSFRGADIDTYITASNRTSNAFTMKSNYRSTPNLIGAMNQFFTLVENPFNDKNICYDKVENGKKISELQLDGNDVKALAFMKCKTKSEIAEQTAFYISELLINDYKIKDRKIIPSDIGVLVRSKLEGREIKNQLNRLGIPSVTLDDSKVMDSEESQLIYYVLKASLETSNSNINRALLSHLTKVSKDDLLYGNKEQHLINFKNINKEWERNSVLGALEKFYKLYRSKQNILSLDNGERMITNLLQIGELLHRKELEEKLSPEELLNALHNILDGQSNTGDEFVQRIESDDDAVKIVTIHKSKGLAYNIVFAPHLDFSSEPKSGHTFIEYKNDKKAACFSLYKSDAEKEIYSEQTEQENRRLIYVALTRAVYKNYIFSIIKGKSSGSIKPFIDAIEENEYFEEIIPIDEIGDRYSPPVPDKKKPALDFTRMVKKDWSVLSYSQISNAHIGFEATPKDDWETAYSKFVFSELPKGPIAGNFMHDLFENSDFTAKYFTDVIESVSPKYANIYKEEALDNYNALIENVLNSNYGNTNFKLSEIKNNKKLPELEFYFELSNFSADKINSLTKLVDVEIQRFDKGMMYGFIDLFFEHEGQYYILDWKSNFLGNNIEDYAQENIEKAMRGNNYHLQYLIYTVAVKRFLELKIPNFNYDKQFGGVFYVFLRGCRSGEPSGIFYTKPEKDLIDKLDALM